MKLVSRLSLAALLLVPAQAKYCWFGDCGGIPYCSVDSYDWCECEDDTSKCDYSVESCKNDAVGGCQPIYTVRETIVLTVGPWTVTSTETSTVTLMSSEREVSLNMTIFLKVLELMFLTTTTYTTSGITVIATATIDARAVDVIETPSPALVHQLNKRALTRYYSTTSTFTRDTRTFTETSTIYSTVGPFTTTMTDIITENMPDTGTTATTLVGPEITAVAAVESSSVEDWDSRAAAQVSVMICLVAIMLSF